MDTEIYQIVFHLHNIPNGQCADVFTVGQPAEILYNNAFIHKGKVVKKIEGNHEPDGMWACIVFESGEMWMQRNIDAYGTKIIKDDEGTEGTT